MTTPVIFRKFKEGDVIALFPTIPSDYLGRYCGSYMPIGQHSGADYDGLVMVTKLATPAEYAELLKELVQIGYDDLKVYKRETPQMRAEYQKTLQEYRNAPANDKQE